MSCFLGAEHLDKKLVENVNVNINVNVCKCVQWSRCRLDFFFSPLRFIIQNVAASVEKEWKQTVYNRKCCDTHIAVGKLEAAFDGALAD